MSTSIKRVWGVDPSTKTGIVQFIGDSVSTKVLSFPEKKGMLRLQSIAEDFDQMLVDGRPDVVAMEGYAFGNQFTLALMVEVGVIFRMAMYNRKIPCYIVPPTVLKKFVTGKGNAKKADIAVSVRERWSFDDPSDDVVDAYVLARIAKQILEGSAPVVGVELLI